MIYLIIIVVGIVSGVGSMEIEKAINTHETYSIGQGYTVTDTKITTKDDWK